MKLLRTASVFFTMFLAQTVLAGCDMFINEEGDQSTEGSGGNDGTQIAQGASIVIMVIYGIEWFVLLFPNIVPLARPASSMLGAVMCLLVTEICTHFDNDGGEFQAFCYIDYDTLGLLFGLMLIVVMVDDSGILLMIEMQLESHNKAWMITKCCFVCAILSAIVMNDTICLFFTAPILEACRKHPKIDDPLPFLLALSSNSNIGSALTITGNPQNAMIASISASTSSEPITYYNFLVSMAIPCTIAWTINWLMLLIWYRKGLGLVGGDKAGETQEDEGPILTEAEKKARKDTAEASNTYKLFLVVGIIIMVVGFFVGVDVAGISVAFGILFMCTRTVISSRAKAKRSNQDLVDKDSEKFLLGVDWPLLVLFTGLFIMISACVQTGYPDDFFRATFSSCRSDPTHDCTALFAVMIILFSNIISNVPLILLIKGYISGSMTDLTAARNNWMFISWVCTLAGNFILLGSAANLIVADQARKMGQDILTTINHGVFGIPSTVTYTVAGVPVLLKTMI